jgi:hypothetical protein
LPSEAFYHFSRLLGMQQVDRAGTMRAFRMDDRKFGGGFGYRRWGYGGGIGIGGILLIILIVYLFFGRGGL